MIYFEDGILSFDPEIGDKVFSMSDFKMYVEKLQEVINLAIIHDKYQFSICKFCQEKNLGLEVYLGKRNTHRERIMELYKMIIEYDKNTFNLQERLDGISRRLNLSQKFEDLTREESQELYKEGVSEYEIKAEQKIAIPHERQVQHNTRINEIGNVMSESRNLGEDLALDTKQQLQIGNYHFNIGNYSKALEFYDSVLKEEPRNFIALKNRGSVLYRQGEYEQSIQSFEEALKIEPSNFDALIYRAFIPYKLGRLDEARQYYEKASEIKINEDDIDAMVNKGIAFRFLARQHFEKALKITTDENNVDNLVNKGIALDFLQEGNNARQYYRRALEIERNSIFALYSLARSHALEGKVQESTEILQRVISLHPGHKNIVKVDPDFERIKGSTQFNDLVKIPFVGTDY